MEQQDLKQGVYECIEFLKSHATNGVLLNCLLLSLVLTTALPALTALIALANAQLRYLS